MSPSPPRWILPAILVLAVALRLLAWHGTTVMTNDGPDFLWQAERLLAGDVHGALSHPYHPLYGAATALLAPVAGSVLHAALAVSILSALGIVLAVRALAVRLFPGSRAIPLAAALLAAVHGRLAITTSDIQSDGLFIALIALGCAALLAAAQRGGSRPHLFLAGLLSGLAYLTRPEGLFLVVVAGLWWLLAVARRVPSMATLPGRDAPPAARHATAAAATTSAPPLAARAAARATAALFVFLAGVALCVLPYVFALHEMTGRWGLSLKPSIAAAGLSDAGAGFALPPDSPLASPIVFKAPPGSVTAMPEGFRVATPDRPVVTPDPSVGSSSAGTTPAPVSTRAAGTDAEGDDVVAAGSGADAAAETVVAAADDASVGDAAAGDDERVEDADVDMAGKRGAPEALPAALMSAMTKFFSALRADTALLACVGLCMLWRMRRGLALVVLALVGGWFAIGAVHAWLSHGLSARHTLVATVVLLPLAGAGLVRCWTTARNWTAGPTTGRRVLGGALAAALVLAVLAQAAAAARPRHVGSEARLQALAWAAAHSDPGRRLAVHRRKDGFFGGRPVLVVNLPCFDAEFIDKLVRHEVALLVLDEQKVKAAAPHWLTGGRFAERARFGGGDDTVLVLELVRD